MDANSMADKIIGNIKLEGSEEHKNSAKEHILAICKGIVDEIQQNAVVLTVDSHGDTCNNGTIK